MIARRTPAERCQSIAIGDRESSGLNKWAAGGRSRGIEGPVAVSRFLLAALVFPLCLPGSGQAKSYSYPSVSQTVTVGEDGSLDVVDTQSFAFRGEFHNGFLTVNPRAGGRVKFSGVEDVEGKPVRNVRVDGHTIRWQYDAIDETRRFRVAYRLIGEIERASDAALLDRLLIETEHEAIGSYHLTLQLPRPATLFKVFVITGRGLTGRLNVVPESGKATVELIGVAADEWVRVRALFDPDQIPGLPMGSEPRYEQWLKETDEETRDYRARARAQVEAARGPGRVPPPQRKPLPTALAAPMILVSAAFSWWSYRAYKARGMEPKVAEVGEYYREPAEEIPPAVVPYVLEQFSPGSSAAPQALGATFLDFARRGFLTLKERETSGFLGLGRSSEVDFVLSKSPNSGEMTTFEMKVWRLLEASRGSDTTVTPKEMQRFMERHTTWIQDWASKPRDWYESTHGSLLTGGHALWMAVLILLGMVVLGGQFAIGLSSSNPVLLATGVASGLVGGLFGIICGAAMPRWRPEALVRALKWKAYARFLSDFSAMKDAPAEHYKLWDYHFVYATALGVSKKYLANLKNLMEMHPERFATPAWIGASGHRSSVLESSVLQAAGGMATIQSQLESLQANLSRLERAISTTTSSGGGFSGGGVGGASGGGGARGAS